METAPRTRVLVADDDALVAMVLEQMLENQGYEVVGIAADGLAAVECTVALRPDVVLMDLRMPEIDGIEATRRIMERCPVPVIALTAYGSSGWQAEALDAGMVDFLSKPATAQALGNAIARARSKAT
jgi:CheY-like chemotaxis protein